MKNFLSFLMQSVPGVPNWVFVFAMLLATVRTVLEILWYYDRPPQKLPEKEDPDVSAKSETAHESEEQDRRKARRSRPRTLRSRRTGLFRVLSSFFILSAIFILWLFFQNLQSDLKLTANKLKEQRDHTWTCLLKPLDKASPDPVHRALVGPPPGRSSVNLTIFPELKSTRGGRVDVSGSVADPKTQVWVVVNPPGSNDFEVWPAKTQKDGKTWKATLSLPGTAKEFRLMAIAGSQYTYWHNRKRSSWPEGYDWRSKAIEVDRP